MSKSQHIGTLILTCVTLAACGGGSSETPPSTQTSGTDQISTKILNPSAAVQSLLTFVGTSADSNYRYQYSQGTPETFNGVPYQVQNVLRIDANGRSATFKNYYTTNPFSIFTPPYSYLPQPLNNVALTTVRNTLSAGLLPTSAKVGDFGVYETSRAVSCDNFGAQTCSPLADVTSAWTLEKNDEATARLCYGVDNNPRLTPRTCFILNSNSQILR
jgi:hypothetical protein